MNADEQIRDRKVAALGAVNLAVTTTPSYIGLTSSEMWRLLNRTVSVQGDDVRVSLFKTAGYSGGTETFPRNRNQRGVNTPYPVRAFLDVTPDSPPASGDLIATSIFRSSFFVPSSSVVLTELDQIFLEEGQNYLLQLVNESAGTATVDITATVLVE